MDDEQLIDILLYTGEGASLDYKVQQYPHDGATPEAKGELLKDILAFANAWRQENAYILIGVSDSRELIGLDKDLDDSRLQQFINGKTNRPIHFSYRSITYKKVKLGLYTIEVQERPIYARQGKAMAKYRPTQSMFDAAHLPILQNQMKSPKWVQNLLNRRRAFQS